VVRRVRVAREKAGGAASTVAGSRRGATRPRRWVTGLGHGE